MASRARSRSAKSVNDKNPAWTSFVANVQSAHERSSSIQTTNQTAEMITPEDGDLETVRDLDHLQATVNETIAKLEAEKSQRAAESADLKAAQDNLNTVLMAKIDRESSPGGGATAASKYFRKLKPKLGSQVAFRLSGQRQGGEEEWIQCEVTKVYVDGQRYEVRDPEPDEHNNPGQSYRANISDLIVIPDPSEDKALASLPPYPPGSQVLARYPETTTFYRAEVIGTKRDGKCRLKFEGEEEEGKETEVEQRLVLPLK